MVVRTAAQTTGRSHNTSGHEGVLAGLVVGGVDLVNGADGAAASDELHTSASLHFTSSKEMLRYAENACCKHMFQVSKRYIAIVSDECYKNRS
jgi:hypothetical protein